MGLFGYIYLVKIIIYIYVCVCDFVHFVVTIKYQMHFCSKKKKSIKCISSAIEFKKLCSCTFKNAKYTFMIVFYTILRFFNIFEIKNKIQYEVEN